MLCVYELYIVYVCAQTRREERESIDEKSTFQLKTEENKGLRADHAAMCGKVTAPE